MYRRAALYTSTRSFAGANPPNLAVERASKYNLVINRKNRQDDRYHVSGVNPGTHR
jgi:hypothetical protein